MIIWSEMSSEVNYKLKQILLKYIFYATYFSWESCMHFTGKLHVFFCLISLIFFVENFFELNFFKVKEINNHTFKL